MVVSIGVGSAWFFEIASIDNGDSCGAFFLLRLVVSRGIWSGKGILALSREELFFFDVVDVLKIDEVFSEIGEL